MPTIIDLNAEAAKLTMFRGRTPQTTCAERKGSAAQLASLPRRAPAARQVRRNRPLGDPSRGRAGLRSRRQRRPWTSSSEDGPHSFALGAGMIAVVPPGAWHRFRSADGETTMSATIPGDHIDLDVDDPRTVEPGLDMERDDDGHAEHRRSQRGAREADDVPADAASRRWRIERAASRNWPPTATALLSRSSPRGRIIGNRHLTGDELIHILDGTATLEMVGEDGPPQSFALRAGMVAVIPQGAWHRFHSAEGATQMAVTPFPGEISSSMSTTLGRSSASRHEVGMRSTGSDLNDGRRNSRWARRASSYSRDRAWWRTTRRGGRSCSSYGATRPMAAS